MQSTQPTDQTILGRRVDNPVNGFGDDPVPRQLLHHVKDQRCFALQELGHFGPDVLHFVVRWGPERGANASAFDLDSPVHGPLQPDSKLAVREVMSARKEAGECAIERAYVSHTGIRQHSPAFASIRQHSPAFASIRQHSPAFASIRQHYTTVA
jgi:hypothetical protein